MLARLKDLQDKDLLDKRPKRIKEYRKNAYWGKIPTGQKAYKDKGPTGKKSPTRIKDIQDKIL